MEKGTAPRCSAAVSTSANSGRFVSMMPTVSSGPTPSAASPSATRRTRSPYSVQVSSWAPPGVRSATSSAPRVTEFWKASQRLATSRRSVMRRC